MPENPAPPPRRQMNVRLPEDLIADLDARRAEKGLSRDVWVERGLRFALAHSATSAAATTGPRQRTAPPPRHR